MRLARALSAATGRSGGDLVGYGRAAVRYALNRPRKAHRHIAFGAYAARAKASHAVVPRRCASRTILVTLWGGLVCRCNGFSCCFSHV